jgi:hypothetical protein
MINQLDERNIELVKELYTLKHTLDVHKLIGINIDAITNHCAGKLYFQHVMALALDRYTIGICKVYEYEKRYPLNSIPGILKHIEAEQIPAKDNGPISAFVGYYTGKQSAELSDMDEVNAIYGRFVESNQEYLSAFLDFRDKRVAHSEAGWQPPDGLPSHSAMEALLMFAIDFYSMIHEAFIGGGPVRQKEDKRIYASLYGVLEKLCHSDLKKDFAE